MDKIDFRIHANFMGREIIVASNNQKNRDRIVEASNNLEALNDVGQWYAEAKQEAEQLEGPKRAERLKQINEEYLAKVDEKIEGGLDGATEKLVQRRKDILDAMVDEWKDGPPPEEFYSNEHFDDFALNRFIDFFLNPVGVNPQPSNGSAS